MSHRIGVVIPCLNEELTVASVIRDCRAHIPSANIYVFDNNSSDKTAARAKDAGAIVIHSPRPGKGHVIQHAFSLLEEDHLLMLDGDGTYPAKFAPKMIEQLISHQADMVVGVRKELEAQSAYPKFHKIGNWLFSWLVSAFAGRRVTDVFSGYRAMNREFYETVELESAGFEIESELTLKALSRGFVVKEIPCDYGARPPGSHSKLRTFHDGARILKFIFLMTRDCRPLPFFTVAALICVLLSGLAGIQPIVDYMTFKYVYTVPRAILAASLMVMAMIFFAVGLILDSQIRMQREQSKQIRKWLRRQEGTDNIPLKKIG